MFSFLFYEILSAIFSGIFTSRVAPAPKPTPFNVVNDYVVARKNMAAHVAFVLQYEDACARGARPFSREQLRAYSTAVKTFFDAVEKMERNYGACVPFEVRKDFLDSIGTIRTVVEGFDAIRTETEAIDRFCLLANLLNGSEIVSTQFVEALTWRAR